MTTTQRGRVRKAMVPLLVLVVGAGAMSACSDNSADTASTEPAVDEAPTTTEAAVDEAPTPAEEPDELTAETAARPGATYVGEVEGEPGLAGTVTMVISESGEAITELTLDLDLSDYACDATMTMSGGMGLGMEGPIAIEDDSFEASSDSATWEGAFESAAQAAGTVRASLPMPLGGAPCEIGPFSWTAEPA